MVTGDVVYIVPGAELMLFLKISAGCPCCCWILMLPCICICCCCPVMGDSVIVPFWTGALENVTRLLFIVTIVDVWLLLLLVGYTNLTGSFFGIFIEFRMGSWGGGCWPEMKFEKICWWLTLCCRLLKWLLFIVDWTLLFDSVGFVKFALFADNEDAVTRKTEIGINKS